MDKITKILIGKEYEKSNNLEVIKEFYVQCPSKDYVGWIKKEVLCMLIEKKQLGNARRYKSISTSKSS